jgi:HEAT repeat protein
MITRLRGALTLVAFLLGLQGAYPEDHQPTFDGKPLGYWLERLREVQDDPRLAPPDWHKAPWALSQIGAPAVPALIDLLRSEKPEVRLRAIRPLLVIARGASDAAPALTRLLTDDDARIRQWAAAALGQMGAAGAGAIPALNKALADGEASVRQAAAAALGGVGALESVGLLQDVANADPEPSVRRAARLSVERLDLHP